MEYQSVFKTLNQFKVKYLVCGGMAVNIYGIPRMTADIDLLIEFNEKNISDFESALKLLSYQHSIPFPIRNFINKEERMKAISEKNLIAYSYYNSSSGFMNLDVLLDVPMDFEEMWNKKSTKNFKDTEIYLVSVDHLIAMKKYSNRIQDQNDVLLLSKLIK